MIKLKYHLGYYEIHLGNFSTDSRHMRKKKNLQLDFYIKEKQCLLQVKSQQ